ncbi:MAG: VWA domain-containing protein [Verrucomicrobiaceae bacterium]|nr:VWA domain-containing protein [Verrucomicrobiaceae bacterium]
MTFSRPEWLWLLLVLPVLLFARVWGNFSARKAVRGFTAPRLRDVLLVGVSAWRSWTSFILQMLALAGFILAFCGPRWGTEPRERRESGRNVIIAVDTSRSMLANDVLPDRLTRCRLAAQDLLSLLPGDRVGLIAFAGNAYLQAPLTTDHDAVVEAIQTLDVTSIPRGGSELHKAVKLAIDTFAKSPARNHGLIIFSDGGDPDPDLAATAKLAAEKHVIVLTVGVGTEGGSFIPDPDPEHTGDWVRDTEGNVVKTKLESALLQELARTTHGRYFKLGATTVSRNFVQGLLSSLEQQEATAQDAVQPIERFYWPLSAAMLLLMISWLIRPAGKPAPRIGGIATMTAMLLMAAPNTAQASNVLTAKFFAFSSGKNLEKEARDALEAKDYKGAAEKYDELLQQSPPATQRRPLAFARGIAAYQLKDFDRAVTSFSEALESADPDLQTRSHSGLGNTLYEQGVKILQKQPQITVKAWRDSLHHFEAALELDPDNANLKENRDFVRKLLDELEKKMEEQRQKQQQEQQGKKGKKGKKGQKGKEGQQGKQGQNGQQGQDGQQPGGEEGEDGDQTPGGKNGDEMSDEGSGGDPDKEHEGQKDAVPEGNIQAGKPGDQQGDQQQAQAGQKEGDEQDERSDATGFSPNEARNFLRTFADDQKSAKLRQQRQEPARGKDW